MQPGHKPAHPDASPRAAEPTAGLATTVEPAPAPFTTEAEVDSGIGSSSEYDQDNSEHHLLQAQDDTSEASTDEG